jgi:NADH:ubiquinone oxidoreductase subunit 6 (subunit J)
MSVFSEMIIYMSETDIIHLFFPWLLLLAFTFGVLKKYEFFEDDEITGAVSLSISFLAIAGIYFFLPENIFANFGAILAFATFAALGFMIVMAIAGVDISEMEGRIGKIPLLVGGGILGLGLLVIILGALPLPDQVLQQVEIPSNLIEDVFMPILFLGFILAVIAITSM